VKILYLCNKHYWLTKMSRIRFLGIDAIARHPGVELVRDGPGWDGFVDAGDSERRHKPDIVIWYKPLGIPGHANVKAPKALRLNEMYDRTVTSREINDTGTDIVIHHHANEDLPWYRKHCPNTHFINVPHCADPEIFRDYKQPRQRDIVIVGSLNEEHYPFRCRLARVLPRLMPDRTVYIHQHPGYEHADAYTNRYLKEYARMLNQSRIAVTCSSKWRYRLGKYSEIPLCHTALAADIPDDGAPLFRTFVIELDPKDSDEEIAARLEHYLETGLWRDRAATGLAATYFSYKIDDYARQVVRNLRMRHWTKSELDQIKGAQRG